MPTVKATAKGFHGGQLRNAGDKFYVDGEVPSWAEKVDEPKPESKPARQSEFRKQANASAKSQTVDKTVPVKDSDGADLV